MRNSFDLAFTGIQSRDSIQIGLGLSFIMYGLVKSKYQRSLVIFMLIIGIFYFNICYLNYQSEWYRQLAYQSEIKKIPEVFEGGNYIVYCDEIPPPISDRRFYTWTANTVVATGEQNVFMIDGDKDRICIENEEVTSSIIDHYPMFSDYLIHTDVNGEIYYSINISLKDTIKLKYYELFDKEGFADIISNIGSIEYESYK